MVKMIAKLTLFQKNFYYQHFAYTLNALLFSVVKMVKMVLRCQDGVKIGDKINIFAKKNGKRDVINLKYGRFGRTYCIVLNLFTDFNN